VRERRLETGTDICVYLLSEMLIAKCSMAVRCCGVTLMGHFGSACVSETAAFARSRVVFHTLHCHAVDDEIRRRSTLHATVPERLVNVGRGAYISRSNSALDQVCSVACTVGRIEVGSDMVAVGIRVERDDNAFVLDVQAVGSRDRVVGIKVRVDIVLLENACRKQDGGPSVANDERTATGYNDITHRAGLVIGAEAISTRRDVSFAYEKDIEADVISDEQLSFGIRIGDSMNDMRE
jgi:hypothetical protein